MVYPSVSVFVVMFETIHMTFFFFFYECRRPRQRLFKMFPNEESVCSSIMPCKGKAL